MTVMTDRLANEAGTGAPDFPNGMPTVEGVPIVESGSNSDGRWTRWSDGTQLCSVGELTTSNTPDDGDWLWSYPMPFTSLPELNSGSPQPRGNAGIRLSCVEPTSSTGETNNLQAVGFRHNDVGKFSGLVSVTAHGRWK